MKKYPVIYLIIGIIVLTLPNLIYLIWLVPQLSEAYNAMLASGGIIGSAGFFGASKIPNRLENASLYKLACNSFTIFIVLTLVQEFISEIILLGVIFVISFIIFKILVGKWKNGRRRKENAELAEEIARITSQNTK